MTFIRFQKQISLNCEFKVLNILVTFKQQLFSRVMLVLELNEELKVLLKHLCK